jgi:hypothetical protein
MLTAACLRQTTVGGRPASIGTLSKLRVRKQVLSTTGLPETKAVCTHPTYALVEKLSTWCVNWRSVDHLVSAFDLVRELDECAQFCDSPVPCPFCAAEASRNCCGSQRNPSSHLMSRGQRARFCPPQTGRQSYVDSWACLSSPLIITV